MAMPTDAPIIDTMIGFPRPNTSIYDFLHDQLKDEESKGFEFPAQYMFKDLPQRTVDEAVDPVGLTLVEMDRYRIRRGLVGVDGEIGRRAVTEFPDRFVPIANVDPNDVVGEIRRLRDLHDEVGIRAIGAFPAGCAPPVPIDDAKFYPIYALCCEFDIPIFVCAGVPGPRLPMAPQHVERIDQVMYDFPELTFVTRHGCEPWEDLAVKLMLKWPGLHYSTSAFAPRYYPKAIIDYANSRGADKIIYAGYFPMGLTLERIFGDLPDVGFKDHVWPKFLHENAARILKLD